MSGGFAPYPTKGRGPFDPGLSPRVMVRFRSLLGHSGKVLPFRKADIAYQGVKSGYSRLRYLIN